MYTESCGGGGSQSFASVPSPRRAGLDGPGLKRDLELDVAIHLAQQLQARVQQLESELAMCRVCPLPNTVPAAFVAGVGGASHLQAGWVEAGRVIIHSFIPGP